MLPHAREAKKAKRPDTVQWLASFQDFQKAAHACGVRWLAWSRHSVFIIVRVACQVWDYAASCAHLRILLELAGNACLEEKRHVFMQYYDEVARLVLLAHRALGHVCAFCCLQERVG